MLKKHPVLAVLCAVVLILVLAMVITGAVIMNAAGGSEGEFEYLIVLGTKVNGTEPSSQLQDRINAAYDYLCGHEDVICVVSGGWGDDENLSEAQCMYNELTAMGIPAERILIEDQATTTVENLEYSLALIEAHCGSRPEQVGLLSSEYHLLRANMFAQRQNVSAVTVPAKSSDTLQFVQMFLREIIMVWYYSIGG